MEDFCRMLPLSGVRSLSLRARKCIVAIQLQAVIVKSITIGILNS